MDNASKAVKISIRVDRMDGSNSELSGWIVPNVVAEDLLCRLVDHRNIWTGTIKEIEDYSESKKEAIDFFKKNNNSTI